MAQATAKITLNSTREIPFNRLKLSQANVRKVKGGVSIESLAADISRRGLLQSLNVRAELDAEGKETGDYRVPAGGRRYRALELLIKQKKLAKTAPVPCIVSAGITLEAEDSLAENVHRENLHPLEEFRAYQGLHDQSEPIEDIAAAFCVTPAYVRQRLRLANVSPKLLEIYAEDGIKLEQLMAFSITTDHPRQEQVWDAVSRSGYNQPQYIRRMLTETAVRANDRRALYVGVDAYIAAGGPIMRDLFEPDNGGWLQDPALLEQLVFEKLEADAQALRTQEGWKWVEAALDFPYGHTSGLRRFYGEEQDFIAEEIERYDTLKAEYEKLDAEYAEATEYSEATEERIEALENELELLSQPTIVYDPQEVARGGAFVSIGSSGVLKVERGFVRPEDEPPAEDGAHHNAEGYGVNDSSLSPGSGVGADGRPTNSGDQEEEEDATIRPLPDRLVLDLTAARTVAMRNALANDPTMAMIAVLHAFVLQAFYSYGSESCLEVKFTSVSLASTQGISETPWAKEIDERHKAWGQDLPKDSADLWDFLIGLDEVSRQVLFAHCASLSLNALIEPWNRRAHRLGHVEQLTRAIGFDMVDAGWEPTVDAYLGRVTKARILEAVREARGDQSAQLIDHLKKADMAREAARLLEGTRWLPEPLRSADNMSARTPIEAEQSAEAVDADTGAEPEDAGLPAFLAEDDTDAVPEDGDDDPEHLEAAE